MQHIHPGPAEVNVTVPLPFLPALYVLRTNLLDKNTFFSLKRSGNIKQQTTSPQTSPLKHPQWSSGACGVQAPDVLPPANVASCGSPARAHPALQIPSCSRRLLSCANSFLLAEKSQYVCGSGAVIVQRRLSSCQKGTSYRWGTLLAVNAALDDFLANASCPKGSGWNLLASD